MRRATLNTTLATLGGLSLLTTLLIAPGTAAAEETRPPVARIDLSDQRQEVEGFGAASQYFVRYLDALTAEERGRVLDALFAEDKAGMTIIRNETWGGGCDGDETVRCPEDSVGTKPNPLSHSMAPGEFKIHCPAVPDPSGRCEPGRLRDHYQVWFHREAAERQPDLLPWLNQHNAPEYMKEVPYEESALRQDQYQAYADYLARSVRSYRRMLGVPVEALSLANEPTVTSADKLVWNHEDLRRWTVEYLVPTLEREGVEVDLMGLEDQNWRNVVDEFADDPAALGALDIYASHAYDDTYKEYPLGNCRTGFAPQAAVEAGKRIWMSECTPGPSNTEQAVRNARRIHEFFTGAQGNAWVWWRYVTGSDDSTLPDDAGGLVSVNDKTGEYEIKKSLWTTAQFSRFVRPGWNRVDATDLPVDGVYVSAFTDPETDEVAVVVVNENAEDTRIRLDIDDRDVRRLRPYRTSDSEDVARLDPVTVKNGRATVDLAGQSVTTFTAAPR